jgi:hypothetical protein
MTLATALWPGRERNGRPGAVVASVRAATMLHALSA